MDTDALRSEVRRLKLLDVQHRAISEDAEAAVRQLKQRGEALRTELSKLPALYAHIKQMHAIGASNISLQMAWADVENLTQKLLSSSYLP